MTNLVCNNCGTSQEAKIFEASIPFDILDGFEFSRYFLLVIERCEKCKQKKILPIGLSFLGYFVRFDFLKIKQFEKAQKSIIQELFHLPRIGKGDDKKGFYLNYSEYGTVKRCYQNLSSMKLGLDISEELGIGHAAASTFI
jgi:hypothetical protein